MLSALRTDFAHLGIDLFFSIPQSAFRKKPASVSFNSEMSEVEGMQNDGIQGMEFKPEKSAGEEIQKPEYKSQYVPGF